VSTTRSTTALSRAAVRLGLDCDNECVFCAQAGLTGRIDSTDSTGLISSIGSISSIGDQLAKLREDHDEVTFIGGEPTLDSRLVSAIAEARALGYTAIGLQTNARQLASEGGAELFPALVDAGLSDLQLSIHAPTAEAHDYHTGRAGSFAACLELIARAQRADITVVVVTVVTRSNFRELAKLPPVLKRRGVAAWLLEVARPHGRAADNFARVVPRVGMAIPYALHALEQARRNALSAWIRGAPLCALGPFAVSSLPTQGREYPPPCRACPSRPHCPGVDSAYVEVFGHGELRPVDMRSPSEAFVASPRPEPGPSRRGSSPTTRADFDDGRQRLMRMFVGVGELVVRPPQLYSPAADAPADALPDASDDAPPGTAPGKKLRLPVLANDPTPTE
jgi:molybdenum cofactor biosynthesis enzyme MoaA